METITLEQIAKAVAFIVALLGGFAALKKIIKEGIEAALKGKFEVLEASQKEILKRLDTVDLENCKNYLVTFLSEVARGEPKDEAEVQRFWEEYEHYTEKGGNSYIKHKKEELTKRGLL